MGESKIAHQILAYLAEHPNAQDTLEGIMQWWLLHQEIRFQKELILKALDDLVKKGLIVERKLDSSLLRYQANWDKAAEINSLLQAKEE